LDNFDEYNQLKQLKKGWINEDFEHLFIDYDYLQKCAYDAGKRRNKDSQCWI